MKKFAELEFIQNLSWKQIITYSAISITTVIGATWTIATRTTDSKADYVNMRYAEISALETEVKRLKAENTHLKSKLGINTHNSSATDSTINTIKEIKLHKPIIDENLDLIYTLTNVWSSSVRFSFTYSNGRTEWQEISIGSSLNIKTNKQYQFILIAIDKDNQTAKYIIKEIPTNR